MKGGSKEGLGGGGVDGSHCIQHIPCEDKKVVVRRAVVVGFRDSPDDKFHDQYVWHIIFVGAVYVASFRYHVSICHE